jgi:hypothetical protein
MNWLRTLGFPQSTDEGELVMANAENQNTNEKSRRYTIDLTPAASAEVDKICDVFGLKIVDLFRYSLLLMRIYTDAVKEGKQMRLVSRKNPSEVQVIELPLFAAEQRKEERSDDGVEVDAARAK